MIVNFDAETIPHYISHLNVKVSSRICWTWSKNLFGWFIISANTQPLLHVMGHMLQSAKKTVSALNLWRYSDCNDQFRNCMSSTFATITITSFCQRRRN